jgi:uncharacterized repeat protein (TIGR01451 family)
MTMKTKGYNINMISKNGTSLGVHANSVGRFRSKLLKTSSMRSLIRRMMKTIVFFVIANTAASHVSGQGCDLTLTLSSKTNVLCYAASTGEITVAASNGTTPYEYKINGGTFQSSGTFSGLAAGTYVITAKDAASCEDTIHVAVLQPAKPLGVTFTGDYECFSGSSGSATASASGGTGPYSYVWSTNPVQTGASATGLLPDPYTVTVTDDNNCTLTEDIEVTKVPQVSAFVASASICSGEVINIGFTTVPAGLQVVWTNTLGQSGSGNVTAMLTNTGTGNLVVTYTAKAISTDGCEATVTVAVTVKPIPVITPSVCEVTICPEGTASINFSSDISGTTISWVVTDGLSNTIGSGNGNLSQVINNVGTYLVTINGVALNGCNATEVYSQIIVEDDADPSITACPPDLTGTSAIEGCGTGDIATAGHPAYSATWATVTGTVFGTEGGAATDNCGVKTYEYFDATANTCPIVVTRTWRVTDAAGNLATCVQVIHVDDNTNPSITCPVSGTQTVIANSGTTYVNSGSIWNATGSDNCITVALTAALTGATNLSNLITLDQVIFATGTTLVTWTAADACGNTVVCSFSVEVLSQADLSLTKIVDDATPNQGDLITFTITVSNAGPAPATGVRVKDVLPAGLTYSSDNGSGAYASGTGIWTIGSIAVGGSASLQISATVSGTGTITNYAEVWTSDLGDPDSSPGNNSTTEDDDDAVSITVQEADLKVTKTVSNSTPNVGDNVVFTIRIDNLGFADATNVTLTDQLPNGYDFISYTATQGTYNSSNGLWTVGTIPNGDFSELALTVKVKEPGTGITYLNTASITHSDVYDPVTGNNTDDEATEPVVDANWTVTKVGTPATYAAVNDVITYAITVDNTGNVAIRSVVVTDPQADAGTLLYVSGDLNTDNILDVNETWVYTAEYTITQADLDLGYFTNTATANGTYNDNTGTPQPMTPATGTETVEAVPAPSWTVTKVGTPATYAAVNDVITYAITVDNTGNVAIRSVVVTDPQADAGTLLYVSGDLNTDNILDVNETWVYTAEYTITQADLDLGYFTNTATANGTYNDNTGTPQPMTPATGTETVEAVPAPSWTVTKVGTPATYAAVNDVITYAITVDNTGNVAIRSVVVTDPQADAGTLLYVSGDLNTDNILDVNETWVYTAEYTITQADLDLGYFTNTATANGTYNDNTGTPQPMTPATGTETVEAVPAPSWTVTKVGTPATYAAVNDVITYAITVDNTGNVAIRSVVVTDPQADAGTLLYVSGDLNTDNILDVNETWVYTAEYTITQADLDLGYFTNTATANGTYNDNTGTPQPMTPATGTETVEAVPAPSWTVTKVGTPATYAAVNDVITYAITVDNTGNVAIRSVVVTDPQADAGTLLYVSGDLNTDNILDVNETWVYTAEYTITQADLDLGYFTNTATANGTYNDNTGTPQPMTPATGTETVEAVPAPSWTVTKVGTPATYAAVNDVITYAITVDNTGNVAIRSVVVTDPQADAGTLLYVSGDLNTDNILDVNETWVYTAEYTITQADLDLGYFTNTATANGTYNDNTGTPQPMTPATGTETVEAVPAPSWTVTKVGTPATYAAVNDVITYAITVDNTGNVAIRSVVVTDPQADAGTLLYVSGDLNTDNILDVNETWVYTAEYTITQADLDLGYFTNTATANGTYNDNTGTPQPMTPATGTETVEAVPAPSWTVTKVGTPATYAAVNDVITYAITVDNTGNVAIRSVVVTDPQADAGTLLYVSGDLNTDNILDVNETWVYTAEYTITQADLDLGYFTNTATANGTYNDNTGTPQPMTPATGTETVEAVPAPSWTVTKVGTPATYAAVNDVITYAITVDNTGNVAIRSVVVTDPQADAGTLLYVSGDLNTDNILDVNETWVYTAEYTITQADLDLGYFTNTATANGTYNDNTGTPQPMTPATGTETVEAVPAPSWTVTKVGTPATYAAVNDVITYAITVDNTGNVAIRSVVVTDPQADAGTLLYVSGDLNTDNILDVNETWVYTAEYTITQADLDLGYFTNTATANGTYNDNTGTPQPMTPATGTETVEAVPAPSWTVTKVGTPATYAAVNDVITYAITVDNTGNVAIRSVVVTDPQADAGTLLYVSGDLNTDNILDVNETWVYTAEYTITQADLDLGYFTNTATANGTYNDNTGTPQPMTPATGTETVEAVPAPSWTVTKVGTPATYAAVNDVITYAITVDNTGNVAIRSVVVTDPQADAGTLLYVSGDLNTDNILDVNETWVYTAEYTITQADLDLGYFTNTATANGTYNDNTGTPQPMTPATGTETVEAVPAPSWTVTKVGTPATYAAVNDVITYAITVDNTGNVAIRSVVVTDPQADAGTLLYVSGDLNTDNILDVNETWVYTAEYTITQADLDLGYFTNTATANGTYNDNTGTPQPMTPATGTETVEAVPAPSWTVTKVGTPATYAAVNDVITYAITVDNTGNVAIRSVVVTDPQADAGTLLYVSGDLNTDNILDVNETWVYTAEYTITQADLDLGYFTNTALRCC